MMGRESGDLTRRFEAKFDAVEDDFSKVNLIHKGDFRVKINELEDAGPARKNEIKAELGEMFEKCGIECKRNQDVKYYFDLYYKSNLPTFFDLENQILMILYNNFEDYYTPSQYMEKLVKRLSKQEDIEDDEPIRLIILKRFIKYCDYAGYNKSAVKNYIIRKTSINKPTKDNILESLDDDIFELIENRGRIYAEQYNVTDEQNRDNHLAILYVSDDLAKGNFRTNGKSIDMLYRFAIAFDMTYYSYDNNEIQIYDRDIEINLFENYYNNNLMRYVDENFILHRGDFEKEPLGRGINYKNYAEIIYLYYISREGTAEEKFRKIRAMMQEVKSGILNNQTDKKKNPNQGTQYYRDRVQRRGYLTSILDLDENAFCDYMKQTFKIDKPQTSPFMQAWDQNTAYKIFIDEVKFLDNETREGIWFIDTSACKNKHQALERIINNNGGIFDSRKFDKLLNLLSGIDIFLRDEYGTTFEKVNKENVSRTALITAYYHNFIKKHKYTERNQMNLKETFDNFKVGIDPLLVNSYYQPLSVKNIFDIVVVFSAYSKLVL